MTPGLALFYGGMVRAKSVLNMMMMSFGALASISVLWVLYGYSIAFGNDIGFGLLGDPVQYLGLKGLMGAHRCSSTPAGTYPVMAFVAFQAVFAIITVALISGAIADRAKFGTWMIFAGIWATIVYFPVAHWVFDFTCRTSTTGGWIANNLRRSTSPVAPRCTSTPVSPVWPWPSCSASGSAGSAIRCGRTT